MKRTRPALVAGATVLLSVTLGQIASASQPWPPCDFLPPAFQGEAWLAVGGGVRQLRANKPTGYPEFAADLAATFPLAEKLRLGPWGRVGTSLQGVDHSAGLRVALLPKTVDWFLTTGKVEVIVDGGVGYSTRFGPQVEAGKSHAFAAGRVSFGFRAPQRLCDFYDDACACSREAYDTFIENHGEGPPPTCRPFGGLMAGVRFYAGIQASIETERLWEVSFGLSFEVAGAIWFLVNVSR